MLLSVHVDGFKLAGPTNHMKKGWQMIATSLEHDPPQPLNLHRGCVHGRDEVKVGASDVLAMTYNMEGLDRSPVDLYQDLFPKARV